jgi:hypothetical protein
MTLSQTGSLNIDSLAQPRGLAAVPEIRRAYLGL